MGIIRTLIWILITALLVAFIAINWTTAPVNFWPLADGTYLHFEWPVGIIALVFFLLGLLPTWLLLKGNKWHLNRKINALEKTVQASVPTAPILTSTQLDAQKTGNPQQ